MISVIVVKILVNYKYAVVVIVTDGNTVKSNGYWARAMI